MLFDKYSGYIFQYLGVDLLFLVISTYILWNFVRPALSSYRRSKYLDQLSSLPSRHWFYGHIYYFGKTPHERLHKFVRKCSSYPTMVNSWRGPLFSVMSLYHHDSALPLLSSGAPKDDFVYKSMRAWLGDGLLVSKGKKWQRNRHLLTPAFHFSILKPYTLIFNDCCRVLINKWAKTLSEEPIDVSGHVSLMTLDTMLQCAMSSTTNCQNVESLEHPYISAIRNAGRNITRRMLNPLYFFDFIYYLSPSGRSFKKSIDILHELTEKIIKERREAIKEENLSDDAAENETIDGNVYRKNKKKLDFLDILLQTKDQDGKGLKDGEIRDEVDTFLFEGHDTTSSGISWGLYNLAKYPEYQEKCRSEVIKVVGNKRNVEWEDLNKLQYLTMFIKENMRLYPPVFIIGRKLHQPVTIKSDLINPNEAQIPKGTTTTLSIFGLHRNPHTWENSEVFDPERFSKENCAKRNSYAYLPFSAGSRNCIGQNFAMNEMKIVLAQILRRFELYVDEDTPEPILEPRIVLRSKDGIFIKLKSLERDFS